jgi:hypothetical protein
VPYSLVGVPYATYPQSQHSRGQARVALADIIAEAEQDPDLFGLLVAMMQRQMIPGGGVPSQDGFTGFFLEAIRESSIVLTTRLVRNFDELVSVMHPESDYQRFLEQNPVFIDPLAAQVIPQHRLGTEFVTDFVIRRHDSRYVVVEIEKPSDRIFTGSNDFTAPFTHAVGQVLDFQGWVADNVAYAQKRLPAIVDPYGVVIMGRRSDLSTEQELKLRRWNINSKGIEIILYDDLSSRAKTLHRSLRSIRET